MLSKALRLEPRIWYIALTFGIIALVEFLTPPEFIIGYLYVIPILLSNWFLSRRATLFAALLSVVLTLGNLIFPRLALSSPVAVVDRLITVVALLTVAYLAIQYRQVQEESARQKAKLRAQEELSKVREDFIATLTHDLRTPLLGAQQTLWFLHQQQFGPVTPAQVEVITLLQKSNDQQLSMVNMLLAIYRNDVLGLELHPAVVDLDDLCAEQMTLLQDLALGREIELVYEGQDRALLLVDRLQLARVVANLVSNAINHTPRGGSVAVRLLKTQMEYRLLVEDTGSGIPQKDLKRVFDRFYQSGSPRHVSGTGLGLYLSRQIVEAHGGKIWAANRPERGCTFGVSLPVGQDLTVAATTLSV